MRVELHINCKYVISIRNDNGQYCVCVCLYFSFLKFEQQRKKKKKNIKFTNNDFLRVW